MGTSGLGALLVKEGLLTQQDRMIIGKSTGHQAWAFAKGVLASGLLDETELASLLAERTSFSIAPRNFLDTAEHDALAAVDVNLMQELEVYPLKLSAQTLTVAMCDPLDKATWNQLAFFTGLKIKPVIAPLSDICAGLKRLNPNFEPHASEFESFFHNHAPAAYRQQARQEKPVARKSDAASLLPEEPIVEKVSFPKLEDLPPMAAAPSSEPLADVDLDAPESSEIALGDLPPLEGDDAVDASLAEEALDAMATGDLALEDAPIAPESPQTLASDENLSLEEAEAALDAGDLDFSLGGDEPSLDLDLEIPQAPSPSEEPALTAVPVDELVAEGEPAFDGPAIDVPSLEATDLGLEEDMLTGDAPDLTAPEADTSPTTLDEEMDLTALEADTVAEEPQDLGLEDDVALVSPEDELAPDLALSEESILGDIPIENDVNDDFMEQVVFHPAMSDLNQALLYLSFASSLEDAYRNAVSGWAGVTPTGVIYELDGKDALPRFVWENGALRTNGLDAWRAPAARGLVLKIAAGSWQDVPPAEPFSSWAKTGTLVGCRVGEEKKIVMIAAAKAQTWQIEGFQQAVLSLLQGLAQKMALPSQGRERRVVD